MKRAEVQLPDPLYQQVERLAGQLHLSVPELLLRAAQEMVQAPQPCASEPWHFPEGRHLGPLRAPAEDLRMLANDTAAD